MRVSGIKKNIRRIVEDLFRKEKELLFWFISFRACLVSILSVFFSTIVLLRGKIPIKFLTWNNFLSFRVSFTYILIDLTAINFSSASQQDDLYFYSMRNWGFQFL